MAIPGMEALSTGNPMMDAMMMSRMFGSGGSGSGGGGSGSTGGGMDMGNLGLMMAAMGGGATGMNMNDMIPLMALMGSGSGGGAETGGTGSPQPPNQNQLPGMGAAAMGGEASKFICH